MRIFSSPNIDVFYVAGESDVALITFSPSNWVSDGTTFWGLAIAEKTKMATIGFVAHRANWFPEDDVTDAVECIRPLLATFRSVITYGTSMGGYAALKYSHLLGATCAISFVPQFSIAPDDVGHFDRRFAEFFVRDFHGRMAVRETDVCRSAFVFFDPALSVDRRNVDLIASAVPRLTSISVRQTGHSVIELFASTEKLKTLFGLCVRGAVEDVKRFSEANRRGAGLRVRQIITTIGERKGASKGLEAFHKYRAHFTDRQAAQFLNGVARVYLADNDPTGAERVVDDALRLAPSDAVIMTRMSVIQERLGNDDASICWAEKALEANKREASYFVFLAKQYARLGRLQSARETLDRGNAVDPKNDILIRETRNIAEKMKAKAPAFASVEHVTASNRFQ